MAQIKQDIKQAKASDKKQKPLTELEVKKEKVSDKPKKLADGGGMYLLVQTSGTKCWPWITDLRASARRWRLGYIQM